MKKILIVRFSSIGDIVLTTALPRILDRRGDIEVHYLTKKAFQPLLAANPHIHKIYSIEASISEVLPQLRKEQYDLVLDLHRNIRSGLLLLRLMRPFRRFRKLNFRKWLLVRFKWDILPDIHVVDRYLEIARDIASNDGLGLDLYIPPEDEVDISSVLPALIDGYYCLSVGSLHFTKQIPANLAVQIINALHHPVILLGSSMDSPKADQIIAQCDKGKGVNLCGKLNINQSASLIKQSQALITSDTGLMHIAAALKKRIVSIWGSTVPEFGMAPYLPKGMEHLASIIQVDDLSCRPCSKLGFERCPKGHFKCMNDIRVTQITKELEV